MSSGNNNNEVAMAQPPSRFEDVLHVLKRPGALAGDGFDADSGDDVMEMMQDSISLLVIGAGGLGCELLKDLALLGFQNMTVVDMDTIDVSNLNRQFLFRPADVGKPKAVVAAEKVNSRVQGCRVTPKHARVEELSLDFYRQFHVWVLGLDSVEARSYVNSVACSLLEYDEDGNVDPSSIKPMVDGGTEGFKGHARVIYPGMTPCFQCTLWLFPPQTKYPLCTLAETPRTAAHCIEYAHLIAWPRDRPDDEFDADNPEHMLWMFEQASSRAATFGIPGVTPQLTSGVVKNIIPAIASTNAIVASMCATEVLKIVTMCLRGMDNYTMYMGGCGVYTHVASYERDPQCIVCGAGIAIKTRADSTLASFRDALTSDSGGDGALPTDLRGKVTSPSISHGSSNLYMAHGPLEPLTRANLSKSLRELLFSEADMECERRTVTLMLNDKALAAPVRLRVTVE